MSVSCRSAFEERPALCKGFNRIRHETQIEKFGEMDGLALDQNRARVALAHHEGLPQRGGRDNCES